MVFQAITSPDVRSGVEGLFSTIGDVFDGATSVYGDYLELRALDTQVDAQRQAAPQAMPYGSAPLPISYTPDSAPASNNNKLLIYGAVGLVGLGVLSMFARK